MEAWREELYHYGIKGMKWKKRKKKSSLESAGRNYEMNARSTSALKSESDWWAKEANKAQKRFKADPSIHNRIERDSTKQKSNHAYSAYFKSNKNTENSKRRLDKQIAKKKRVTAAKNKARSFINRLFKKKR